MRPRVKICCIQNVQEAHLAVREGADAIGLVSAMPSGPGIIPESLIAEIAHSTPPGVETVLLTSRSKAADIIEQQRRTGVSAIQLCEQLDQSELEELRRGLPGIKLIHVVHLRARQVAGGALKGPAVRARRQSIGEAWDQALTEARQKALLVHALLLDTGDREAPIRSLGGTGQTHDWCISAQIVKEVSVPVYLAGGLNAGNVGDPLRRVRPFGVDVCSGVRVDGKLALGRLGAFMNAVAAASGMVPRAGTARA
jgi:phosphoribosylanthranilate isomerase